MTELEWLEDSTFLLKKKFSITVSYSFEENILQMLHHLFKK